MAGNSRRRGAVRKSPKGTRGGTGGHGRKRRQGKGPTPKAEDRVGHPAAKRKAAAEREAGAGGARGGAGDARSRSSGGGQTSGAQGRSRAGGPRGRRPGAGGAEYVAGRNPVVEALRAGVPATALYVQVGLGSDQRVTEAIALATERGHPLLEGSRTDLDRLTDGAVHQGLALRTRPYEYAHPDDLLVPPRRGGRPARAPTVVALDGITDPRNLGAVVRSAAAFGVAGVVVPERRSAGMTAGAWKTSAGAAARVPVARAVNLTRALRSYAAAGLTIVGLDASGDVSLPDLDVAGTPVCLVVGAEEGGLSRLVRETCDVVVSIPMSAGTESLNAGVAAGVALYAVAQQR